MIFRIRFRKRADRNRAVSNCKTGKANCVSFRMEHSWRRRYVGAPLPGCWKLCCRKGWDDGQDYDAFAKR